MKESQILSAFQETAFLPEPAPVPAQVGHPLVCDACHVGVVLRAVLFVQVVVAVVSMFGTAAPLDWLTRMSLITGASLPATLLWLIATCGLKRLLVKFSPVGQQVIGVVLGGLAGLYGCGVLTLLGLVDSAPWLASGVSGAALATLLVVTMALRARGMQPAATAARLAELQARIRPHFLFNTLNSAIALVRAEPRKAERLLEDLSDLFRYALAEQGASVTLASEVALAQRYLAIEQVRFGDRIQVQWELDDAAAGAQVPPLLLQPLLENAVKHGVEPSATGARIHVSTQRRGTVVVIKVSNTVDAGVAQALPGHRLALANVAERLALLHDVQGQFRSGLKDGVFQVRIEVPL